MMRVPAFDIYGVLTDGKVMLDDTSREFKSLSYQVIDAIYPALRRGVRGRGNSSTRAGRYL